jgi:hypothetical protein
MPPSWQEFDDQLSWKRKTTRFLSFGTWKRASGAITVVLGNKGHEGKVALPSLTAIGNYVAE